MSRLGVARAVEDAVTVSAAAAELAAAAAVAARAVRVGGAGVRVRMPALGSVEHGSPAAALKGCPCLRCEQLRDSLIAAPAPAEIAPVDEAVEVVPPEPDSARLPVAVVGAAPAAVAGLARTCGGRRPGRPARHERHGRWSAAEVGRREPEAWRDEALCRQVDPELFFPEAGGSTREARQVCAACPVRVECLEWAIEHDQRYGVWGGLSANERSALRRQRGQTERAG